VKVRVRIRRRKAIGVVQQPKTDIFLASVYFEVVLDIGIEKKILNLLST